MASDIALGTLVDVPAGRGVVKFVGSTSFQAGKWIGIELDAPNGKNDGSVKGVRYFESRPNHGIFVKGSQVKAASSGSGASPRGSPSRPASAATSASASGHARRASIKLSASVGPGAGAGHSRQSSLSRNVTPALSSESSRAASPQKHPSVSVSRPVSTISASGSGASLADRAGRAATGNNPPVSGSTHASRLLRRPSGNTSVSAGDSRPGSAALSSRPPSSAAPATNGRRISDESASGPSSDVGTDEVDKNATIRVKRRAPPPAINTHTNGLTNGDVEEEEPVPQTARTPAMPSPRESPKPNLSSPAPAPSSGLGIANRKRAGSGSTTGPRSPLPPITPRIQTTREKEVPKEKDDETDVVANGELDIPDVADESSRPESTTAKIHRLETSLRVLTTRHTASLSTIQSLQSRLSEAETFISIRPKLTQKLQSLSASLQSTQSALADEKARNTRLENRLGEIGEMMELSGVEREVAEERAEVAEEESERLKNRVGEMESELCVLRGEMERLDKGGAAGGDGEDGDAEGGEEKNKEALGKETRRKIMVLERQNERLKDVLIRLRDSTHETELEAQNKIADLERELGGVDELHAQYEQTLTRLQLSESQVEELKLQLDDALGAEEMLVGLTEKNLSLTEKNEDLRLTIEELEQLKELADELEEHHVETERALEEEMAHKDVQLHETQQKVAGMQDELVDYEGTIQQFRELVVSLQADLESHRAFAASAQNESLTQANQSANLRNLNTRLQNTALRTRTKQIDTEIQALEASEARELLGIVQPYLPQNYVESDSASTNCYLFFVRMGRKCEIVSAVVAGIHGLGDVLNAPPPPAPPTPTSSSAGEGGEVEQREVTEVMVGVCEMRTRMAHLSALCRRFAAILRRADSETFLSVSRFYTEIAPLERRMDMHVDLLRRDEFRERECVADVAKILAQFEHIAETYFSGFTFDLGERSLDLAMALDCDLDMFAAATGLTKSALAKILKDPEVAGTVEEEGDPVRMIFDPLQRLLDQCRAAKGLSRKLVTRIESLIDDSAALKDNLLPQLGNLNNQASTAVDFSIQLAQSVGQYLADIRASKDTFSIQRIIAFAREISNSSLPKRSDDGVWGAIAQTLVQLTQVTSSLLPTVMEKENVVKITGTAPWINRIDEIRAQLTLNAEADRKVAQLNEEIQNLARTIKGKEQNLQESNVKIELMERRLDSAKKQSDSVAALEHELERARSSEKLLDQQIIQTQEEANQLRNDLAKLQLANTGSEKLRKSTTQVAEISSIALEGNLETSYLLEQIEALRGTVRFLRSENLFIKGQDFMREVTDLPPLLRQVPRAPPTPPPEDEAKAEGLEDSDDSDSTSDHPPRRVTPKSLAIQSKLLYRDYVDHASRARVVDLSAMDPSAKDDQPSRPRAWRPRKQTPGYQVLQRRRQSDLLQSRMSNLLDKAAGLGLIKVR